MSVPATAMKVVSTWSTPLVDHAYSSSLWTEAGFWPRLHAVLLAELRSRSALEMDDCAVDGSHVRALKDISGG